MPTSKPRYTITDTGATSEMLDLAGRAWPETRDRKELLLRLAAIGGEVIAERVAGHEHEARRERQHEALSRATELVDTDLVRSDAAWR